jgi:DNA-binding transcriptional ArsR family regulator
MVTTDKPPQSWTLLSNYTYVLLCLARDPHTRIRDVADKVGITERAAMRIVTKLEEAGILTHEREGRRNHYTINLDKPLRHRLGAHCTIGTLLAALMIMSDS